MGPAPAMVGVFTKSGPLPMAKLDAHVNVIDSVVRVVLVQTFVNATKEK